MIILNFNQLLSKSVGLNMKIVFIICFVFICIIGSSSNCIIFETDSADFKRLENKSIAFYDSLENRISKNKLSNWVYNKIISSPKSPRNEDLESYQNYKKYEDYMIGKIHIKSLDVFGPDFEDTLRITELGYEKLANRLHSKSNMNVIRKNLWIKVGQKLDPNLVMDNERLIRGLPYLKDVRFILEKVNNIDSLIEITILTKDVFSLGISGSLSSINFGEVGIYDKNIFGIGHEIGARLVAHSVQKPNMGLEAYYAINNINGDFFNFSAGYSSTFQRKGFYVTFERDFLRPQSVYAGGLTILRSFRSNQILLNDLVQYKGTFDYIYADSWYGRRLKIGLNPTDSRFQMTLSGRIKHLNFYNRYFENETNSKYYANSTMYLGGLSFSRRSYVRDYLVYSYGIIEDIPKGYLHEIVGGYEKNEFGDRFYSHIFLSSGDLFNYKPYYFYTSLGIGSFWNSKLLEQGIIDFKINFISRLFNIWNVQARQFIRFNYTLGINRFEEETLLLANSNGIRGFRSRIGNGQQRLSLKVEDVFFQRKAILNFQTALFTFFDLGLIGSSDKIIFRNNYYAGIGIGARIRNENLIFKTIQFRLAFYPFHPSDVSPVGFMVDEISKSRFYSFQPRGPEPLRFE